LGRRPTVADRIERLALLAFARLYRDLAAERRHIMGFFAFAGIVIVALVIGFAVQMYDKRALSYEWLIIAFAGTFGAYFASENFPGATVPLLEGIKDWGPALDGMYVIPATVTGLILAGVAYLGTRTSGSLQTA